MLEQNGLRHIVYEIGPAHAGMTIHDFLRKEKGVSRTVVVALKKLPDGILLDGHHARTVDILPLGSRLELRLPQPQKKTRPSTRTVEILYEDQDILVYNKPSDMPCHPSGGHFTDTLANVYTAHCLQSGVATPFRAINRLDKDTTGAVVCAKNQLAAGRLWKSVQKQYIGIVEGIVAQPCGQIDLPIERIQPYAMLRVVTPEGQPACTEYRLLGSGGGHSLLAFTLHTGRTHQIRVHMAHLGHPLAGDELYGGSRSLIGRQALHCASVSFPHPLESRSICLLAPMQNDMKLLTQGLGIAYN